MPFLVVSSEVSWPKIHAMSSQLHSLREIKWIFSNLEERELERVRNLARAHSCCCGQPFSFLPQAVGLVLSSQGLSYSYV